MKPTSEVRNIDCMEFMRGLPDKFFDLVVADPPYGIGRSSTFGGKNWKSYNKKDWDNQAPKEEYFIELFRVSRNQIIWGANYYPQILPPSMGWIFWDKGQKLTMSDGELAFSNFDRALRSITINRCEIGKDGGGIHPTQKPIALYAWLLENYAKPGDKIFDPMLGSGSSRIAAYKLGFDFWGCELDHEYFEKAEKRFRESIAMPLFDEPNPNQITMFEQ